MECPQGMDTKSDDEILILDKCIYGLVQGARQYHKKAVAILKRSDLKGEKWNLACMSTRAPNLGGST